MLRLQSFTKFSIGESTESLPKPDAAVAGWVETVIKNRWACTGLPQSSVVHHPLKAICADSEPETISSYEKYTHCEIVMQVGLRWHFWMKSGRSTTRADILTFRNLPSFVAPSQYNYTFLGTGLSTKDRKWTFQIQTKKSPKSELITLKNQKVRAVQKIYPSL